MTRKPVERRKQKLQNKSKSLPSKTGFGLWKEPILFYTGSLEWGLSIFEFTSKAVFNWS